MAGSFFDDLLDELLLHVIVSPRRRRRRAPPLREPRYTPEAEARAEALLERHLSLEQRQMLKRHGWFKIEGEDGSVWTIRRIGVPVNVTRTGPNGETQTFCSQLSDAPVADTLLVQKLSIEATGGRAMPVTWDGVTIEDENLFRVAR